jgi:CDP-diacylglycerol pyrophosphatase
VRLALQKHASAFTARWGILKFPLEGARYYGLKVKASEVEGLNPFARLASLPGAGGDLRATSLAVVSAPANDAGGGFYVLAYRGRRSPVEKLLDPTCSMAP